jgi:putative heme iron utilization protein
VSRAQARDAAVYELLARERNGVLATLSDSHAGWPFASIVAFALSAGNQPLLLLSALAEHTRNLREDPRASLFIQDQSAADPQAGARVTLLGRVESVADAELASATDLYLTRHPQAARYLALPDFRFYVLRTSEARLIAGFGDMGWVKL